MGAITLNILIHTGGTCNLGEVYTNPLRPTLGTLGKTRSLDCTSALKQFPAWPTFCHQQGFGVRNTSFYLW